MSRGGDRETGSGPDRGEDLGTEPGPAADAQGFLAGLPIPSLATPLGPLAFRPGLDREGAEAFTVAGRRAVVRGGVAGIREVLGHPFRIAPGPRVRGAGSAMATVTALGAERRLDVDGSVVTERVTVSRDAPVAWLEWTAGRDTELELEWEVTARDPEPLELAGCVDGRCVWVGPRGGLAGAGPHWGGPWAAFVLSAEPRDVRLLPDDDGAGLRARVAATVPGRAGLRLALVAARAGDDPPRLLRVADRTAVAVRARAGAADRLLKEGLRVWSDGADGGAVDRARIDLAFRPVEPVGPWTLAAVVEEGLERLAAGDFGGARSMLDFLLRRVRNDGAVPGRGFGPRVIDHAPAVRGGAVLLLLARYVAWTGDLAGVRSWWPVALRVAEAGGATAPVARALAVTAEELGDEETAEALRRAARETTPGPADPTPGEVIRRVVHGLLGADPDAPRGRLVLRPRPAGRRIEVRGLAVGDAAVDIAYGREGDRHRLEVRQEQGAAPLQLVLEPVLPGGRVTAVRVDGATAELDVKPVGGAPNGAPAASGERRWQVPVQLVLDRPRTLEVEMGPG